MADDTNYGQNLTLDEIVFENRNKEYGAYDLRSRYPKILTRSFLLGTLLFLIMALTPFIILKIKQMNAKDKQEVDANLIEIIDQDVIIEQPEEAPPPPPPPPKEEPKQEVIQNVVPEPKKAPKVETPPPPISKQLETTTGLQNQEGVKTPAYTPPPPPPSTGTKATTAEVKVSTTEVYDKVDQSSQFPGGLNAFRQKFQDNFDTSAMDGGEGNIKGEINFVVERDGSITDIKVNGSNSDFNSEAIRAVKSIRNKWVPAKVNGQAVRSRYRFPVTMNFE
ncbi:energy transducer TonB [Chryseobacterium sp.]|uniref:energy transducer TonB n=1 Tax=Chryseobacterium sp. TaxID=1871047 RepID=UPI0011C7F43F|nr:energy transducer TonB [Chryseobacterium sp.]TXF77253.1 energy transducer TonB [Chryseobacterium sp.]